MLVQMAGRTCLHVKYYIYLLFPKNDIVKTIDVKEMGMRFKLIRQKLGITQTNLAEQLGTSQVMIYRIEKGEKIMSSLFLKLVLFFAPHVSLDALFAKQFDIEDERVFSKDYSVNTLVKEKLDALREEMTAKLSEAEKKLGEELDSTIGLL